MIYSGLDWSGSPGREQGATLVFANVHVAAESLSTLEAALAQARVRLSRDHHYAFKDTRAKSFQETRRHLYDAIEPISWSAHFYNLDKAVWHAQRAKGARD